MCQQLILFPHFQHGVFANVLRWDKELKLENDSHSNAWNYRGGWEAESSTFSLTMNISWTLHSTGNHVRTKVYHRVNQPWNSFQRQNNLSNVIHKAYKKSFSISKILYESHYINSSTEKRKFLFWWEPVYSPGNPL